MTTVFVREECHAAQGYRMYDEFLFLTEIAAAISRLDIAH